MKPNLGNESKPQKIKIKNKMHEIIQIYRLTFFPC